LDVDFHEGDLVNATEQVLADGTWGTVEVPATAFGRVREVDRKLDGSPKKVRVSFRLEHEEIPAWVDPWQLIHA